MIGRRRRSLGRDVRGAVAVEFAILAPMIVAILAGLYEIGRAFQVLTAVNALASQYAISWADCQDNPVGACASEMNLYQSAATIGNTAPQLTASSVGVQMFQVTMNGTTPTPQSGSLSAAQVTAAQNALQSGQTGVIVTVTYTYTATMFAVPVLPTSIPMSFTVVQLKS